MIPLTSYNPNAYQFAKEIHGHVEKARAVIYRWNKIAEGKHDEFEREELSMLRQLASASGGYGQVWDKAFASGRKISSLMSYLAGKSW